MSPVADGSDFGGSLRNPAGWNNVFGFRPTAGRVPFGPTPEIFMQSMGYEGPMARTVGDLALLLSVMAGYDDRAPLSLQGDPHQFVAPIERDFRGVRIGWLGNLGSLPMETGMLDLCLGSLRRLESAGCVIEDASLGVSRERIWDSFVKLRSCIAAGSLGAFYADPAKRDLLKPEAIWEIENGLNLSATDVFAASIGRSEVYQSFQTAFRTFDFLALPTAQVFPFDAKQHWPRDVAGVTMTSYHNWMEVVAGPTLAGCPAIAVAAGFGPGNLPSGIQLIGPNLQDFAVLQLAHAYEQVARDVISTLPPMLSDA